jgi:hypothetical protein
VKSPAAKQQDASIFLGAGLSRMKHGTRWSYSRHPRPFLRLVEPDFVIQRDKIVAGYFRTFLRTLVDWKRLNAVNKANSRILQPAGYSHGISIAPGLDTAAAVIAMAFPPALRIGVRIEVVEENRSCTHDCDKCGWQHR